MTHFRSFRGLFRYGGIVFFLLAIFSYTMISNKNTTEATVTLRDPITVTVVYNGTPKSIDTTSNQVKKILLTNGYDYAHDSEIEPNLYALVSEGDQIILNTPVSYTLKNGSSSTEERGFETTVNDVLVNRAITMGELDVITPALSTPMEDGMVVSIERHEFRDEVESETVYYKTITQDNPNESISVVRTLTVGQNGTIEHEYHREYINGELVHSELVDSRVTVEKIDEVIERGTQMQIGSSYEGTASWYVVPSRLSSSIGYSCASRDFSKGTILRVTSLETGESILVEVTDYGPRIDTGRVIDLDKNAFSALGVSLWKGLMQVRVEEVL